MELIVFIQCICAIAGTCFFVCRREAERARIRAAEQQRAALLMRGVQKFAEYSRVLSGANERARLSALPETADSSGPERGVELLKL
jgi:hypothetical protein